MTPDDVVARAREMVGQEVLLTIRGALIRDHEGSLRVHRPCTYSASIASPDGVAHPDLAGIEPAPPRIEPGALYRNGAGELLRGDHHGGLQGFDGYIGADEITADSELVRVKVVDA